MKFPWSHTSIVEVLKNDDKIEEKCKRVVQDLQNKTIDIAEFVEELGPALTDKEVEIRLKGTKLLSDTISELPVDFLNGKQIDLLSAFFCDRMKDHHSIIPAVLSGVELISKTTHVPAGEATKIFRAIFLNIACQSQVKGDRAKIFNILKNFAGTKQEELKAMGADFVYGVINAVEGERDPRNLVFLFEYMPSFIKSFPLLHLSEEMFETFGCYFPIDFHPNPNDPAPITRDILAEKLSNCLIASPEFSELCITLLLEKLESDLQVAKLDSLNLLIKSTKCFTILEIEPHLEDIWKALKMELLPGTGDKEVTDLALKSIKSILMCCEDDPKILDFFLTTIFTTIMGNLADVGSKTFTQSTNIALICASVSSTTATYVASKLLPISVSQLIHDKLENAQKGSLLEVLEHTLIISKEKNVIVDISHELLDAVQKQFVQVLVQDADADLKKIGIESLTKISEIVTDDNRFAVYTTINTVLLSNDENLELNVDNCLYEYALKHPVEVKGLVVDKVLSLNFVPSLSTEKIFRALSKLVLNEHFKEKIVEFFFKIIFEKEKEDQLSIIAMKTIKILLEADDSKELVNELYEKYCFIDRFFKKVHTDVEFSSDYLYEMSIILKLLIKKLKKEQQTDVIKAYLKSMDVTKLNDLYLTSGIIGFLDEEVVLEDHFENLVNDLTKLAMGTEDEAVKELCHHMLCSLFNKMPDDDAHRHILKKILKFLRDEIKTHNKQAVGILSWIAKGLLSRGHTEAAEIVEDLSDLLEHPSLSHAASCAFEILATEYPQLHLPLIKNLFKQKLFVLVLKKLEIKVGKYSEKHLSALAFVFKVAPHAVLKMNIQKVGPILFKCLNLEDEKTLYTSLKIVNNFLKESDDYFRDHLQTLIGQLISLTTFKDSMKVRIEALQSLLNLTKYPTFILVPYKIEVVQGLQAALDDHKRLVRNAAVETRLKWFVIGSSDEKK